MAEEDISIDEVTVAGIPAGFENENTVASYFQQFAQVTGIKLKGHGVAIISVGAPQDVECILQEKHSMDGHVVEVLPGDQTEGDVGAILQADLEELAEGVAESALAEELNLEEFISFSDGEGGNGEVAMAWETPRHPSLGSTAPAYAGSRREAAWPQSQRQVRPDRLFIAGFSANVTEEEVRAYFEAYGAVEDVSIKRDEAGRFRGFGFVRFSGKEEVAAVLKDYDKHQLRGEWFRCNAFGAFGSKDKGQQQDKANQDQIFVGGLPQGISLDAFAGYFSRFGEIAQATLKEGKGFGFIRYSSGAGAQLALQAYEENQIDGKWVEVKPVRATPGKEGKDWGKAGKEGKDWGKAGKGSKDWGKQDWGKGDWHKNDWSKGDWAKGHWSKSGKGWNHRKGFTEMGMQGEEVSHDPEDPGGVAAVATQSAEEVEADATAAEPGAEFPQEELPEDEAAGGSEAASATDEVVLAFDEYLDFMDRRQPAEAATDEDMDGEAASESNDPPVLVDHHPSFASTAAAGSTGDYRETSRPGNMRHVHPEKVFVAGFSAGIAEEEVMTYFRQYGQVEEVVMKRDEAGRFRGFGFLRFSDREEVIAVLKDYDKHRLRGEWFRVNAFGHFGNKEMKRVDKENSDQIFVGGLPPGTTGDELEEHFSSYGEVVKATVKEGKRFGFVRFASGAGAQLALHAYEEHRIGGRWIEVKPVVLTPGGGGKDGKDAAAATVPPWAVAGWTGPNSRGWERGWTAAEGGGGPASLSQWGPVGSRDSLRSTPYRPMPTSALTNGTATSSGAWLRPTQTTSSEARPRESAVLHTPRPAERQWATVQDLPPSDKPKSVDRDRIFVGGVDQSMSQDLFEHFKEYGKVTRVTLRKGFGFVAFDSDRAVQKVLADYSNHTINGKWVEVQTYGYFGLPEGSVLKKDRVFVGGLKKEGVSEWLLKDYFSVYGPVTDVELKLERGFAFVLFASYASVQLALHDYDFHRIDGQWVEVKPTVDVEASTEKNAEKGCGKSSSTGSPQLARASLQPTASVAWKPRPPSAPPRLLPRFPPAEASPKLIPVHRAVGSQVPARAAIGTVTGAVAPWVTATTATTSRSAGGSSSSSAPRGGGGNSAAALGGTGSGAAAAGGAAAKEKYGVDTAAVFVADLPRETTEEELARYFSEYGNVTRVRMKLNEAGHPKFCFVHFSSEKEVKAVLKDYDRHSLHGRWFECLACGTFGVAQTGAPQDRQRVFVGGLPSGATQVEIEAHFREFGKVLRVDLRHGFAFVHYGSGADAQLCLHAYNRHFVQGKWVEVQPVTLAGSSKGIGGAGGDSPGSGPSVVGHHRPAAALAEDYPWASGPKPWRSKPY